MSETNPYPTLYCPTRSKITLDIMQFSTMADADAKKAAWSQRMLTQARRRLGLHDAASTCCSEAMHQ